MEKPAAIYIILYVIIITTLLNIFFFGNKKLMNDPKMKKIFKVSLVVGIIFFSIALIAYLSLTL